MSPENKEHVEQVSQALDKGDVEDLLKELEEIGMIKDTPDVPDYFVGLKNVELKTAQLHFYLQNPLNPSQTVIGYVDISKEENMGSMFDAIDIVYQANGKPFKNNDGTDLNYNGSVEFQDMKEIVKLSFLAIEKTKNDDFVEKKYNRQLNTIGVREYNELSDDGSLQGKVQNIYEKFGASLNSDNLSFIRGTSFYSDVSLALSYKPSKMDGKLAGFSLSEGEHKEIKGFIEELLRLSRNVTSLTSKAQESCFFNCTSGRESMSSKKGSKEFGKFLGGVAGAQGKRNRK